MLAFAVLWALVAVFGASKASAAPETLWSACDGAAPTGQRCTIPRGVAANPVNGRVYVVDQGIGASTGRRVLELTARGEFLRAWGRDVVVGGGTGFEICVPVEGDECKSGVSGGGPGEFFAPEGIALDSAGSIYVVDSGNFRVQKFNRAGEFVLMFGGDVNKTKVEAIAGEEKENLCPFDPGDECQAGSTGIGKGQFANLELGNYITIDTNATESTADDKVYVGDQKRIQVFDTGGHYLQDVPLDPSGALKDSRVQDLAVDAAGELYVVYASKADVRKLNPASGKEAAEPRFRITRPNGTAAFPSAVAVDSEGSVYAFGPVTSADFAPVDPIWKFDPAGKAIETFGKGEYGGSSTGLATNLCPGSEAPGNLYATNPSSEYFVRAYGTDPAGCFKAKTEAADPVEELSATMNGSVNPKGGTVTQCFFSWGESEAYGETAPCTPPAGSIGSGSEPVAVKADLTGLQRGTTYHFRLFAEVDGEEEKGSDLTFKTKGPPTISHEHVRWATDTEVALRGLADPEGLATSCRFEYGTASVEEQSTPEEQIGSDRDDHLLAVTLKGLTPDTDYLWRIVCANSSDITEGKERAFSTFDLSDGPSCPNDTLRGGSAALLPDCRAYEMVSPAEKNGGDILVYAARYTQAAPDGNSLTYTAIPAFGDTESASATSQYLASRIGPGEPGEGWSNHGIQPPFTGREVNSELYPRITPNFYAFTPDLCSGWVFDYIDPPLTAEGQTGYTNLFRRDNCGPGEGELEALTDVRPPQGTGSSYTGPEAIQGVSEDGAHAVFRTKKSPLLPDCSTAIPPAKPEPTFSFRWLRNGVPIEGATNPVYTPTAADRGKILQCRVFADREGTISTQMAIPAVVIPPDSGATLTPPAPLASIESPSTSSPLTVEGLGGQTLTCKPGSWSGSPTFSFQWYRNGAAIPGATASTYVTSEADVATATSFQCIVTGTNADGAVSRASGTRATSPGPVPAPSSPNFANFVTHGQQTRIYDRHGGALHLVGVLPGGGVAPEDTAVGSWAAASVKNAVSADGSRVYWMAGTSVFQSGIGTIYLRSHPEQGIVAGECTEPAVACTVKVSLGLEGAFFRGASEDGAKALYQEGDKLRLFDLNPGGEPQRRLIAEGLDRVVGASEDLSRVYFVSRKALAEGASEGAPNLYLDEGGSLFLVATLPENEGAGGVGTGARVSADGSRLVFQSRARLTGYDNTDAEEPGKADVELFAYEPGGQFLCISCNPSGSRPEGRELRVPYWSTQPAGHGIFAAAWIPGAEQPLHASNAVSTDGERVFFNSNDALLARDTNATMDVYQWEAPGKGGCSAGSPTFFPRNDGCIDLISSGESPFESEFWEASPSGDDVFFATESSLAGADTGLVDLYDARVGGGFPSAAEAPPCEGEACQSPPPAPQYKTPSSSAYEGPGNRAVKKPRRRCPEGKRPVRRAGKTRCAKKGKHERRRAARHLRRSAR